MPGTFVFRPIEANLTHSTDWMGKMDPYCTFLVDNRQVNGQVCKNGGKHPRWSDAITIQTANQNIILEVKDKDKITSDDAVGFCMVDLREIETRGELGKWYPLYYKKKPAGQIYLRTSFYGNKSYSPGYNSQVMGSGYKTGMSQMNYTQQQQQYLNTTQYSSNANNEMILNRAPFMEERKRVVEQRQIVEPHTYLREVDVVETRSVLKEVEVFEPRLVQKEVQYTRLVPVKKQIETIEPRVVTKDVEVLEPRLVTKQLQVIENIPVIKKIEVIESIPVVTEVESMEPQTFTKQFEVTENIPVRKQVTVTEPITVRKPIEFIEPIITTKTIVKESGPTVIIDQKFKTEIGPASVVGVLDSNQSQINEFQTLRISEGQKVSSFGQQGGYSNIVEYQTRQSEGVTMERKVISGETPGDFQRTYNP